MTNVKVLSKINKDYSIKKTLQSIVWNEYIVMYSIGLTPCYLYTLYKFLKFYFITFSFVRQKCFNNFTHNNRSCFQLNLFPKKTPNWNSLAANTHYNDFCASKNLWTCFPITTRTFPVWKKFFLPTLSVFRKYFSSTTTLSALTNDVFTAADNRGVVCFTPRVIESIRSRNKTLIFT